MGLLVDRLAILRPVRTKSPRKEKVGRTKPDKYSDGPRQTKMKNLVEVVAQRLRGFDEDY